MREIHDSKRLEQILDCYGIRELFDTKDLDFRLITYEKGEIISFLRGADNFLQFPVEGQIIIYALREDGSRSVLCRSTGFSILGDVEFSGVGSPPFLVEAQDTVLCVELPLYHVREALHRDVRFLHYLLQSLAQKLSAFSQDQTEPGTLKEQVVKLFETSPHSSIHGVSDAAALLHCSRRQFQRILSELVNDETIQKTGKGHYRLTDAKKE